MKLNELLNAYRADLDAAEPPKLDHLFEEPVVTMKRSRAPWYGLGALAAAAAMALVFWPKPGTPVVAPAPIVQEAKILPTTEAASVATPPVEEVTVVPVRARKALLSPRNSRIERTTFVALAEMDMLPEPRMYQVVRVSVDEARLVGLGLSEARPSAGRKIAAQVLLGEDGIARAIRVLGEERE